MKNFGRDFIIAFLMVLAIYQTGKLWFGDFSDHNFFSLIDRNENNYNGTLAYTLDRIVISFGDNKVVCRESNIYGSEYKESFDSAVAQTLEKGSFTRDTGAVDWESVLENRTIIYEYNCVFRGADLESMFNVESAMVSEIGAFDTIIISPRADNSFMRVIFYDSENRTSSYAELKSNSIIGKCYETSSLFSGIDSELYYISSVKNGFSIFNDNKFLPQWESEMYSYSAVEPHYIINDTSAVERNAYIFFDNAAAGDYQKDDNNYTFRNETTVVRVYDNSVFEYSNYDVKKENDNSFYANYMAAINIIRKDSFVTNEIRLDSFTYQNGKYVFRFNYKINDMPLVPGEEIKKQTGMNSFIEVETSKGSTDRYKKYACRYTVADNGNLSLDTDFIEAVDKIYAGFDSQGQETPQVDDITLAYIADDRDFGLSWIVDIGENEYVVGREG